jgi:hypothetical protein
MPMCRADRTAYPSNIRLTKNEEERTKLATGGAPALSMPLKFVDIQRQIYAPGVLGTGLTPYLTRSNDYARL